VWNGAPGRAREAGGAEHGEVKQCYPKSEVRPYHREAMVASVASPRKAKGRAEELPNARPGGIIEAGVMLRGPGPGH
jgi:hypothetical protein